MRKSLLDITYRWEELQRLDAMREAAVAECDWLRAESVDEKEWEYASELLGWMFALANRGTLPDGIPEEIMHWYFSCLRHNVHQAKMSAPNYNYTWED